MATSSSSRILVALILLTACSNTATSTPASTEKARVPPPSTSASASATATAPVPSSSAAPSPSPNASPLEEVTSFGDNPGGLKMFVHAPAGKKPTAVVLALHGCGQGAAEYVNAGWNEVADREGLIIVYGEQTKTNSELRCFRWFEPAHIGKDGEAKSLANMVTAAHAKYGTKRAFVTGLSAGGAMASVMLASYPDLFEAGAVMTGIAYKCATTVPDAFACMKGNKTQSADAWGALVPKPASGSAPRVSIWQGETDAVVKAGNREELVKQWVKVHGLSQTPAETKTEGPASHSVFKDASGIVRVESWSIQNMGHGLALDPKNGCGKAAPFALDVGLCSTERAAAFFFAGKPAH